MSATTCVCSACFDRTPHTEAVEDGMVLVSDCCGEALYEIPDAIERFYREDWDRILQGRTVYQLGSSDRHRLRFIEDALADYIEPGFRPTPKQAS